MKSTVATLGMLLVLLTSKPVFGDDTETIVLIRHGEKPAEEIGQLNTEGLNRALALPDVLQTKYHSIQYLFAPGTTDKMKSKKNDGLEYSYLRPLTTIEPTAIRLGLPVNTDFGYLHIQDLEDELLKDKYKAATIVVAWEHHKLEDLVKKMIADLGGQATVPDWPGPDFDSIFVVTIRSADGKKTVDFKVDHEGITPAHTFPTPAAH
jgi:hypothetical protein